MSKDEQIAITEDAVQELREIREMKKYSVQNVPIAAFHDAQATKQRIENEVRTLLIHDAELVRTSLTVPNRSATVKGVLKCALFSMRRTTPGSGKRMDKLCHTYCQNAMS